MKLLEMMEMNRKTLAALLDEAPASGAINRDRAMLLRRQDELHALYRMLNAEGPGEFNTALLDYLFLKEGIE